MNATTSPAVVPSRILYWTALATALIAMLPVGVGAVVTTVDAGMAFADWPTSDGQGMLAYPWLKATGDAFLEHGHRLAGMLTGFVSIILVIAAFACDRRNSIRLMAITVLLGVIIQGLLGGARVVADSRELAMVHGQFAAWVFTLMCILVMETSRRALQPRLPTKAAKPVVAWAGVTAVAMVLQYTMGGLLRHLGHAESWLIHPWFALVVLAGIFMTVWQVRHVPDQLLHRWALVVVGCLLIQSSLGVATWAVRYGYPQFEIMAVQQSSLQTAVRSLHKVVGTIAFMGVMLTLYRAWCFLPATARQTEMASAPTFWKPQNAL